MVYKKKKKNLGEDELNVVHVAMYVIKVNVVFEQNKQGKKDNKNLTLKCFPHNFYMFLLLFNAMLCTYYTKYKQSVSFLWN